jgi:hypothetical protein
MLKTYRYSWRHIPTGSKGIRSFQCESIFKMEDLIWEWNMKEPNVWEYILLDPCHPGR